jgi:DNA-binding CsgD family transcriptional regulator
MCDALGHWLVSANILTPRQEQVVKLAADGMSDKEVARYLGISIYTVREHFIAARRRAGAATRYELIAIMTRAQVAVTTAGHEIQDQRVMSARDHGSLPENRQISEPVVAEPIVDRNVLPAAQCSFTAAADSQQEPRRVGRTTVMTPDRVAAARELMSHYPLTQVARKLGVSRTTLYSHMAMIKGQP